MGLNTRNYLRIAQAAQDAHRDRARATCEFIGGHEVVEAIDALAPQPRLRRVAEALADVHLRQAAYRADGEEFPHSHSVYNVGFKFPSGESLDRASIEAFARALHTAGIVNRADVLYLSMKDAPAVLRNLHETESTRLVCVDLSLGEGSGRVPTDGEREQQRAAVDAMVRADAAQRELPSGNVFSFSAEGLDAERVLKAYPKLAEMISQKPVRLKAPTRGPDHFEE